MKYAIKHAECGNQITFRLEDKMLLAGSEPCFKNTVCLIPVINRKRHLENRFPAVLTARLQSLARQRQMLNIKLNCLMCHIVAVTDTPTSIFYPYWPNTNNWNWISASLPQSSKKIDTMA